MSKWIREMNRIYGCRKQKETFLEFFSLFFLLLGFNLMGYNFISATSLTKNRPQKKPNLIINSMKLLQDYKKFKTKYSSSASCWLFWEKKTPLKYMEIQLKNSWIVKQPFLCLLTAGSKQRNKFQVGNCVSVSFKMCEFTFSRKQWANENSWQKYLWKLLAAFITTPFSFCNNRVLLFNLFSFLG